MPAISVGAVDALAEGSLLAGKPDTLFAVVDRLGLPSLHTCRWLVGHLVPGGLAGVAMGVTPRPWETAGTPVLAHITHAHRHVCMPRLHIIRVIIR